MQKSTVSSQLVNWFKKNTRELPWRKNRNPYRTWVSEIMLQQTQVKTVIPYFEKWFQIFPNLTSLTRAKEEKVLKTWQGLGYYNRARKLYQAAQIVKKKYAGQLPNTYLDLISLPGIGDYTAKAILNFAYKKNYLAIDGNVLKVFARLFLLPYSANLKNNKALVEKQAQKIISSSSKIYVFNEALFELGSLICLPKNPLCNQCPINSHCQAFQKKKVNYYPKKIKQKLITVNSTSLVIQAKKKFLVQFRGNQTRLKNTWEFPTLEHHPFPHSHFSKIKKNFANNLGIEFVIEKKLLSFTHFYTKYKISQNILKVINLNFLEKKKWLKMQFFSLNQIEKLPLANAQAKIFQYLKKNH